MHRCFLIVDALDQNSYPAETIIECEMTKEDEGVWCKGVLCGVELVIFWVFCSGAVMTRVTVGVR